MTTENKNCSVLRLKSSENGVQIQPSLKPIGRVFTGSVRREFKQDQPSSFQDPSLLSSDEEPQKKRQAYIGARTTARFHAIQALYQVDMTSMMPISVIAFFEQNILGEPMDGQVIISADHAHFKELVHGTCQNLEQIDGLLQSALLKGWTLARLDRVILALLRVACHELIFLKKTQARIVINEFVTVATTFFEGEAIGLINGILDSLARSYQLIEKDKPANHDVLNQADKDEEKMLMQDAV